MRKFIYIFLLFPVLVSAQSGTHKYFIRFTDKNGSTFSINNPSAFLSERALNRRVAQNIPIIEEDLPVNQSYVDSVIATGATVFTKSKWFNGVTIECDSATLALVQTLPFVQNLSRVFRYGAEGPRKVLSNGMPLNHVSDLRVQGYDYGNSYNQIHLMNAEVMHEDGFRGDGMIIALLDAGFNSVDHIAPFDSLRDLGHIIATWDFVSNDSSVYEDAAHGMEVLSTIAGNIPGKLVGTAPHASFLLLRSEDDASENIIEEYNWDAAAEYADSAGADVISSSLGYTTFNDASANHIYDDMDGNHCPSSIAADKAASKGILVLVSAGNQGADNWHYISAPADGDSVISVGAVDSLGEHAFFSSFGPAPDGRIKPNVAAKGYRTSLFDIFGEIGQGNGTSFSCPVLAGAATCLWQEFPDKTAMEIKTAIEKSASRYSHPDDSMGYGIPDFRIARYLLSTGLSSIPEEDQLLSVYPNPFNENLQITFYSGSLQTIHLQMFDAIGRLATSKDVIGERGFINTFELDGEQLLQSGIYFLRIETESSSIVKRVVKQK